MKISLVIVACVLASVLHFPQARASDSELGKAVDNKGIPGTNTLKTITEPHTIGNQNAGTHDMKRVLNVSEFPSTTDFIDHQNSAEEKDGAEDGVGQVEEEFAHGADAESEDYSGEDYDSDEMDGEGYEGEGYEGEEFEGEDFEGEGFEDEDNE